MREEFDIVHWNKIIKLKKEYSQLTNADLQWRDPSAEGLLRTISNRLGDHP